MTSFLSSAARRSSVGVLGYANRFSSQWLRVCAVRRQSRRSAGPPHSEIGAPAVAAVRVFQWLCTDAQALRVAVPVVQATAPHYETRSLQPVPMGWQVVDLGGDSYR